MLLTRVIAGIEIFEPQRADGRDLGDVLAGHGPVEVPGIAGQNDDAAGWKGLDVKYRIIVIESGGCEARQGRPKYGGLYRTVMRQRDHTMILVMLICIARHSRQRRKIAAKTLGAWMNQPCLNPIRNAPQCRPWTRIGEDRSFISTKLPPPMSRR